MHALFERKSNFTTIVSIPDHYLTVICIPYLTSDSIYFLIWEIMNSCRSVPYCKQIICITLEKFTDKKYFLKS